MRLQPRVPRLNTLEQGAGQRCSRVSSSTHSPRRNSLIWQTTACLLPFPSLLACKCCQVQAGHSSGCRGRETHFFMTSLRSSAGKGAGAVCQGWVEGGHRGISTCPETFPGHLRGFYGCIARTELTAVTKTDLERGL